MVEIIHSSARASRLLSPQNPSTPPTSPRSKNLRCTDNLRSTPFQPVASEESRELRGKQHLPIVTICYGVRTRKGRAFLSGRAGLVRGGFRLGYSSCPAKSRERTLWKSSAGVTQLVEYLPSKQAVASSSLVPRSPKTHAT